MYQAFSDQFLEPHLEVKFGLMPADLKCSAAPIPIVLNVVSSPILNITGTLPILLSFVSGQNSQETSLPNKCRPYYHGTSHPSKWSIWPYQQGHFPSLYMQYLALSARTLPILVHVVCGPISKDGYHFNKCLAPLARKVFFPINVLYSGNMKDAFPPTGTILKKVAILSVKIGSVLKLVYLVKGICKDPYY